MATTQIQKQIRITNKSLSYFFVVPRPSTVLLASIVESETQ